MEGHKMMALMASLMSKADLFEHIGDAVEKFKAGEEEEAWKELRMYSSVVLTKNMIEGVGGVDNFINEVEHKSHVLQMDDALRDAKISTSTTPDMGSIGQN